MRSRALRIAVASASSAWAICASHSALETHMTAGFQRWVGVRYEHGHYATLFAPPAKVVYLSSESEHVLETPLRDDTAYIVGGLVDHNREKGLTHRLAAEAGVATARLPIDEHLAMSQRRVLAVNHVVEILVHLASGLDWQTALMKAIPERRGAKERDEADDGGGAPTALAEAGAARADAQDEVDGAASGGAAAAAAGAEA